ncbi:MAG: zinc-ribbon domain-containing protein [Lachnospiraceae bacterium]
MFCPNCGTKVEEGALFCGECGTRLEEIPMTAKEPEPESAESGSVETEKMPWEQNVEPKEAEKMPWEQNVESKETEKMPWEQNVEPKETEKMPWEQNMETAAEPGPENQGRAEAEVPKAESHKAEEPKRPSQIRKERQEAQQSGSTITIKKPDINIGAYKDKARRLSKFQIAVIIEVIVLIAVIGGFYGIGSSRNSARSVATQYFKAYMNKDWDTYYDLMDYPDGKFLQKEQFVLMMQDAKVPDIATYEIAGAPVENGTGIQQFYNVQYTVKGAGTDSMQILLTKQGKKSMLFFDTWRVLADSHVAQDFRISVPAGAEAAIDGIKLSDTEKAESDSASLDSYSVTLFSGKHKLTVAVPWFEVYEEEFTAYSGDSITVYDMKLTKDGETAIQAKMQEALEKIYQAAAAGKDFSEVEDLFLETGREAGEESYENLKKGLNDSDSYKLGEVTFSDFQCETYNGEPGIVAAEMSYAYDMQYIYTYKSWRDSAEKQEQRSDDGRDYMSAAFGYDGETYKLASVNIRSVL